MSNVKRKYTDEKDSGSEKKQKGEDALEEALEEPAVVAQEEKECTYEITESKIAALGRQRTCLDKRVLVTIGRMNPLTFGHMILLFTLINEAKRQNLTRVNIVLSATVDDKKNPLYCDQKRQIIYDALTAKGHDFCAIWVEVICMDDEIPEPKSDNPIIRSIDEILLHYVSPEQIILFVGQDRATDFFWLSEYIPISIEYQSIPRPEGAMSATYIRGLVTSRNFEAFKEAMAPLELRPVQLEELYNDLSYYLGVKGGSKKKRKKTYKRRKTSKKTYKKRINRRRTINKKS